MGRVSFDGLGPFEVPGSRFGLATAAGRVVEVSFLVPVRAGQEEILTFRMTADQALEMARQVSGAAGLVFGGQ